MTYSRQSLSCGLPRGVPGGGSDEDEDDNDRDGGARVGVGVGVSVAAPAPDVMRAGRTGGCCCKAMRRISSSGSVPRRAGEDAAALVPLLSRKMPLMLRDILGLSVARGSCSGTRCLAAGAGADADADADVNVDVDVGKVGADTLDAADGRFATFGCGGGGLAASNPNPSNSGSKSSSFASGPSLLESDDAGFRVSTDIASMLRSDRRS